MSDVPLREYMESLLERQEKALVTAKAEMDRRLEGMNEIRKQLQDQAMTFQTREKYEVEMRHIQQRISAIEEWRARHDGMASRQQIYGVVAIVISALAVLAHFVKP